MAPEQTTDRRAASGPQADVWSFGLLAFVLLTGRHYFSSANAPNAPTAAVLREVVLDPLLAASERARQLGADDRLPTGFDGWFARCVHRSLGAAFPDAGSAFEAIARLPAPGPSGSPWTSLTPTGVGGPGPISLASPLPSTPILEAPVTAIETPSPGSAASRPAVSQSPVATGAANRGSLLRGVRSPLVGALWLLGGRSSPPGWRGASARTMAGARSLQSHPLRSSPRPRRSRSDCTDPITIGGELAPALAEAFLQRRTAAKAIVRRRTAPDEIRVEALDGDRTIEAIEVFAHGTTTGFQDLAAARATWRWRPGASIPTRRRRSPPSAI